MQADWIELYFQKHTTEVPFEGASQESLPMLLEACLHFHARAMNVFRSDNVVKVIPTEHVDEFSKDRAHRLTQHMRYTVFRRIPNYKKTKDALLQALPLRGSMFTKIYPDPMYGFMRIKNLRPHELIMPFGHGPREMDEIPRKTERHLIPIAEAKKYVRSGYFSEMPDVFHDNHYVNALTEADEAVKEILGVEDNTEVDDYVLVLEQRRYADVYGDGWDIPIVAWVDPVGLKLVRLTIGYETDEAGTPIDPYASATEPYTHYQYMPNTDGTYGLGHGFLLGDINIAVNRMLRSIIDSSILSSVSHMSGFFDQRASSGMGELKLKLGSFKPVPNLENVKNSFWTPDFQGPAPSLMQMMEFLSARGDRVGMVTDLVTGQAEKVMQPTAVAQLLQQTDVVFSAAQERFMMAWGEELRNIYTFNRKFLPPEQYFAAIDVDTNNFQLVQVMQSDYNDDFQVVPIIERASSAQERIALAEGVIGASQTFPEITFMPQRKREICRNYLEALGVNPLEEVLPSSDEWQQAYMMMIQAQMAEHQADIDKQDDKQEHETKENAKDRTHEVKMLEMQIEADHEDEKVKAKAMEVKAKADAEVAKKVGNVKVQTEQAMGAIKVQEAKDMSTIKKQDAKAMSSIKQKQAREKPKNAAGRSSK